MSCVMRRRVGSALRSATAINGARRFYSTAESPERKAAVLGQPLALSKKLKPFASQFALHDITGATTRSHLNFRAEISLLLRYAKHVSPITFRNMATDTAKAEESAQVPVAEKPTKDGDKADASDRTNSSGRPVRGGPVSWMSLLLLIITGAGLIVYFDREKKRRIEDIKNAPAVVKEGPSVGKAAIGGPFKLVNHEGKSVTNSDFMGKWTLIYFGFTHCPDICPDELQKMVTAIDKIKQKAGLEVVPIFISVDPERDTVEQVREYVKEFHPDLVGLTGNVDDIRQVAREYRVYYMKTEEEDADYLVDHSIVMYLMDPDMEFVKFFGKNNDVDALADGVINEIKRYRK